MIYNLGNSRGQANPHGSRVRVLTGTGAGHGRLTRELSNKPKYVPNGPVLAEILIK